ncbi:MAG TPA: hypothetical protein VEC37_13100 [Bacillota bacterium]|nr:hypothetical protein [Bacillota bacterium]
MPSDYEEFKSHTDELVEMIASLSNSQRQLTLSALDYQALGCAKRHEKENAIEIADDLGCVLKVLIRALKQKVCHLANLVDGDRVG